MKTLMNEFLERLVKLSDYTFFHGKKTDCDSIDRIGNIVRNELIEKEKEQLINFGLKVQGESGVEAYQKVIKIYDETFS